MASLLGDASGGFENDCVVWYECKPELFAKIDGQVLIGTYGVIWVSMVGLSLDRTMNAAINLFMRTVRGLMYCIYWILGVFLLRKVAGTYYLSHCNWYLYMSIAEIDNIQLAVIQNGE